MRNIKFYAVTMAATLALYGCGGGGSDSGAANAQTATPAGDSITQPPATDGKLVYDYSLRKAGGSYSLYRQNLETNQSVKFADDEYTATNLYVGGVYADNFYSPAVISGGENHIRIASRIDGTSTTITLPQAAGGTVVCNIDAAANTNGTEGLVAVDMAESVDDCLSWSGGLYKSWIYHYTSNGGEWWQADGLIDWRHMFFTGGGAIDFLTAYDNQTKTTTVYSPSGEVLQTLAGGQTSREVEVFSLEAGGATRDDSYVAVLVNDKAHVTTRRMLIESGLASATAVLSELSQNNRTISLMSAFNDEGVIISSDSDLFIVDGVQRSGKQIADLDSHYQQGWEVWEAFVKGGMVYVVMEKDAGGWDSGYTPNSKLLAIDLSEDSLTPLVLLTTEGLIEPARGDGVLFFNYVSEAGVYEALIIQSDGLVSISDGHSYYGSALNLEKGGDGFVAFLLKSTEGSAGQGLTDPTLWAVNTTTGSELAQIGSVSGDCEWIDGFYSVGTHVSVYSKCDDTFAFQTLDLVTGSLRWVSSGLRSIF
jgi:hypothetical protein